MPTLRARLGLAFHVRGDLEEANEEAEHALYESMQTARKRSELKAARLTYSGRRDEARQAIRQFLTTSPRDPTRPNRLSYIPASH